MIKRMTPGKRLNMATVRGNLIHAAGQVPDELSASVGTTLANPSICVEIAAIAAIS
jgi:enamine deaminase RidA (YjgF/YER057c/UK114 family)